MNNSSLCILTIQLNHSFYPNDLCSGCKIFLADSGQQAAKNYQLQLVSRKTGIYQLEIVGGDNRNDRLNFLLNDIASGFYRLSMICCTNDQLFPVTTSLLNKLSTNQLFSLQATLNSDELTIEEKDLKRSAGNTAFEKNIKKQFPTAFLVLSLTIDPEMISTVQTNTLNGKSDHLKILFNNTSIIWKYLLFPRRNMLSNLSVIDQKGKIEFSEVSWNISENNSRYGVCYSQNPIELSTDYSYCFQLWQQHENGKRLIVNRLSYPALNKPGNISRDIENHSISIIQYF